MTGIYVEEEIKKIHSSLIEGPARIMGEFHLFLARAERKVYTEKYATNKNHVSVNTPIGYIRDPDVIDWWISGNERNLKELEDRVQDVLETAQILQKSARQLNMIDFDGYEDLIHALTRFSENNRINFEKLLRFVQWLSEPDLRRPALLFAYRPWGSTRIGERAISYAKDFSFTSEMTELSTEVVFGLRKDYNCQYFSVRDYLTEKWVDSHDEEEWSNYTCPNPSDVERLTCKLVLEQFLEYFKFIRDSLRLVLYETVQEIQRGHARADRKFWERFVNFVIERNLPEDRLWDLKKTLEMWNFEEGVKVAGQLSFASDISAFANSFGGVIIIGVTDRPREIVGVKPTEDQLNQITNVIGRLTNLSPILVEVYPVRISSGKFAGKSIIVVCVPQSKETIYIKDKSGNLIYKIRGVSGNEPVKKELIDSEKSNNVSIDNFDFFHEIKGYLAKMDLVLPE